MSVHIDFLEIFPECESLSAVCGGLDKAKVQAVSVDRQKNSMTIQAVFYALPAPAEISALEAHIAGEYGLGLVEIKDKTPKPDVATEGNSGKGAAKKSGAVLMGKAISKKPIPMEGINTESGNVCICGKVFATDSRQLTKQQASVLSFCISDGTGSLHVSKFIRNGDADITAVDKIHDGMYLTVSGFAEYNRYDQDISIDPKHIQIAEKPAERMDTAEKKRVELHMHTRYSSLDAIGDPAEIVKKAASWGHPAVAITDHGVAQAFPEAWHAAEKAGIKVIYGLEGYYINDVDEHLTYTGKSEESIDSEIVAFDVETTGLSAHNDRLTEIGAVILSGGEVIADFNTFVNPKMPIPAEITRLTGIKDSDVASAPPEEEALRNFI